MLVQPHAGEPLKLPQPPHRVHLIQLMQQYDHRAPLPHVLQPDDELRERDAPALAVPSRAVGGACLRAEDLAVAEDEVEVPGGREHAGEEVWCVGVRGGDGGIALRGETHVGGEHGDVDVADFQAGGVGDEKGVAAEGGGESEAEGGGGGVEAEGEGEEAAGGAAHVEDGGEGRARRDLEGGAGGGVEISPDGLHHVVEEVFVLVGGVVGAFTLL